MHVGEEMPLLEEHADMQRVLLEMTSKRLGCVGFINDKGEFTGMLTDGDLRRCLSPQILEEKAIRKRKMNLRRGMILQTVRRMEPERTKLDMRL